MPLWALKIDGFYWPLAHTIAWARHVDHTHALESPTLQRGASKRYHNHIMHGDFQATLMMRSLWHGHMACTHLLASRSCSRACPDACSKSEMRLGCKLPSKHSHVSRQSEPDSRLRLSRSLACQIIMRVIYLVNYATYSLILAYAPGVLHESRARLSPANSPEPG